MPSKPVAVDPTAQAGRAHRWPAVLAWGLWALTPKALPVVNWLDERLRQAGLSELAILEPAAHHAASQPHGRLPGWLAGVSVPLRRRSCQ